MACLVQVGCGVYPDHRVLFLPSKNEYTFLMACLVQVGCGVYPDRRVLFLPSKNEDKVVSSCHPVRSGAQSGLRVLHTLKHQINGCVTQAYK